MKDDERKRQLLLELARARAAMSRAGGGLQAGLDFKTRVKASVRENPAWWIGGAAAGVGLILLVARVRRPVVVAPRLRRKTAGEDLSDAATAVAQPVAAGAAMGVVMTIGRWVLPIVRPMLMSWVTEKAAEWYGGRKKN